MKTPVIFIVFAALIFSTSKITAQTLTPEQRDSIRLVQTSLFQQHARVGNYAAALAPWEFVYENYPASSQFIYSHGRNILRWKISEAQTEEERRTAINRLMQLHNDRITHFGTNVNQPTPWILGQKALDFLTFHPTDRLNREAYGWLRTSVYELGSRTQLAFIQQLIAMSANIFSSDNTHAEQFIQDYVMSIEILSNMEAAAEEAQKAQIVAVRQGIETVFINSGAADCDTLERIYSAKLAANSDNLEWLNQTISFFTNLRCTDSPTFFRASMYAHNIEPTATSARGLAEFSYVNREFARAVTLFEQVISLSDNNIERAEAQLQIALINYTHFRNFPRAREFARAAINNRPNWGAPYLLISRMYAGTRNISDDQPLLNNTVFWAAVEMAERAMRIDPSVRAEATQMINAYSLHFPRRADLFFLGMQVGDSFTVGGWINETVTVRAND